MAEKTKSVLAHLTELRRRLIWIVAGNILAVAVCSVVVQDILRIILELGEGFNLVYLSPSELLTVYIQVALLGGIALMLPYTLFQVWLFVSGGLYKKEKLSVALSLIFALIFFLVGAYFAYEVVLPITLEFFVRVAIDGVQSMISVAEFLAFCLTLVAAFGLLFELPVMVGLLSALGVLRPEFLRKHQPTIIVAIFIIAALITPPDVVSQLLLGLPMVALLQLSVGICILITRGRDKRIKAQQT